MAGTRFEFPKKIFTMQTIYAIIAMVALHARLSIAGVTNIKLGVLSSLSDTTSRDIMYGYEQAAADINADKTVFQNMTLELERFDPKQDADLALAGT